MARAGRRRARKDHRRNPRTLLRPQCVHMSPGSEGLSINPVTSAQPTAAITASQGLIVDASRTDRHSENEPETECCATVLNPEPDLRGFGRNALAPGQGQNGPCGRARPSRTRGSSCGGSMSTTRRTVSVSTPVNDVAASRSDLSPLAEWDPHAVSCRQTDDSPIAVGAFQQRAASRSGPQRLDLHGHRVRRRASRRLRSGGTARGRDEMPLGQTAHDGPLATYTAAVQLHGVARLGLLRGRGTKE